MPIFDVRHQERAQRILLRAIQGGRVPHAYVFHGPPGVGKRMLADRLAMRLLCASPQPARPPAWAGDAFRDIECVDACGRCGDCHTVRAGTHPDLHIIHRGLRHYLEKAEDRNRKGLDLAIEIIREFVINVIGKRPAGGRVKVFIIEEAERMNLAAQSALLKTLEEPPPTTFIVLLTSSLDRMLPTTRSRAHPVPFRALPPEFVEEKLRELRPGLPPEATSYLARIAEGRLGVAAQYADDGVYEIKRAIGEKIGTLSPDTFEDLAGTLCEKTGQYARRVAGHEETEISDTEAARVGLRALLAAVAAFYTDALRRACGAATRAINADQPRVVDALVQRHSRRGLTQAIREIAAAESGMDRNVTIRLVLESLAVRLAQCP